MHVSQLSRTPRIINLISTVDGGEYSFRDDGAGPNGPNALRQALIDVLAKRSKVAPGLPLFVLKEKHPPVDGDQHDPLNAARIIDDEAHKAIAVSKAARAAVKAEAESGLKVEAGKTKKGGAE